MIVTRKHIFIGIGALLLIAAGVAVKLIYFPKVDEIFFQLDSNKLQQAPANVLILRPTHFATSRRSGAFAMPARDKSGQYDSSQMRFVGRNVGLDQIIPVAYQCSLSRVVLPRDVPAEHYDFLVTLRSKAAERFQAVIKKKLGYAAHWDNREVEVLQLKVQIPNAPGLKPGTGDGVKNNFKDGRLYFYNAPVASITGLLEYALKKPVQDKTGLTGSYDFSISWNWRGAGSMDEASLKNSLREPGLALATESETMQVMVVEKY